jgi:hypothetical protein
MFWTAMQPTLRSSLLLLIATTGPAAALTLSVLPAQPVEGAPFILAAGLNGSCPNPTSIVVTPSSPPVVLVTVADVCASPPLPSLLEVPIGPLQAGPWILRVQAEGTQAELPVVVQSLPYRIDLDPSLPQAGSPFILRFAGSGSCPNFFSTRQDGRLLTLFFDDNCPILPPGRFPFLIEQSIGPLPAGDYVVQVAMDDGRTLASRAVHVFAGSECIPSETALCLQQGRFRVEATWRTATAHGVAKVRPETPDSGSLWFFTPDNLELLVKVLNACQSSAPKIWVFAAGITDVEVDLTVTDVARQTTRHYRNALGTPFAPILDTAAFNCRPPNV